MVLPILDQRLRRGMPIRRLWTRPPFASTAIMALLCLFWWADVDERFALAPGLLRNPWQAFRLATYCLCHGDARLLCANLLFFPALGWRPEQQNGALRYLHASLLGAVVSALLYLLLTGLVGTDPGAVVGGYTPVHLALLGYHQRRRRGLSGWVSTAAVAGLLLGLSQAVSPRSPFLLHVCGLLTGMAYRVGIFSRLEPSEGCLQRLRGWIRTRFLRPVRPSASAILPVTDPAAEMERSVATSWPRTPGLFSGESPAQLLPPSSSPNPPAEETSPVFPSGPQPGGAFGVSYAALQETLTDEELLQVGIQASLRDVAEEEVTLSKSSVSSLRLQQLQKMGFPTEEAVVALAATGHVEGAVSLLIGGHVGTEAVVRTERPAARHQRPPSGHEAARK